MAFYPGAHDHPDCQLFLETAAKTQQRPQEYEAALTTIMTRRKEVLAYLNANKLDLIIITAGILGMDGPAVGAATLLPVVSVNMPYWRHC